MNIHYNTGLPIREPYVFIIKTYKLYAELIVHLCNVLYYCNEVNKVDKEKIGTLIRSLRKEKGLTQKELAEILSVSDKTVSKWERGKGIPDISIMLSLSNIFGIEIEKMLEGEIRYDEFITDNMEKTKYYICPQCGNIITSVKEVSLSCCGRRLENHIPKPAGDKGRLVFLKSDTGYGIMNHYPMTKDDYISFISIITEDRGLLIKTYPEWDKMYHISCFEKGIVVWYSKKDGLLYQII